MICICHVSDKMLREFAKAKRLPLRWLRGVKRMHNQMRIHEFFNEYVALASSEVERDVKSPVSGAGQ